MPVLGDLRFSDVGDGPAVLLVHGHPFDRTMWEPQMKSLVAAGFRVVAPDLRGYGESPATPGVLTMSELAQDISVLLDRLELRSAAVVGLSMGGLVTMELVHASPARFWAVAFVATTAAPLTDAEVDERLETATTLEAKGMEPIAAQMSAKLWGKHASAEVVKRVNEMMRANNPLGAAAALRGRAQRPDYRAWLSQIDVPTLVCVGSADTWSTSEVTAQLLGCLNQPQTLLLDDVGHLPNLEAPTIFNDGLVRFLIAARSSGEPAGPSARASSMTG